MNGHCFDQITTKLRRGGGKERQTTLSCLKFTLLGTSTLAKDRLEHCVSVMLTSNNYIVKLF